ALPAARRSYRPTAPDQSLYRQGIGRGVGGPRPAALGGVPPAAALGRGGGDLRRLRRFPESAATALRAAVFPYEPGDLPMTWVTRCGRGSCPWVSPIRAKKAARIRFFLQREESGVVVRRARAYHPAPRCRRQPGRKPATRMVSSGAQGL